MPRKRKEEVTIEPGKGLNLDPELIKQLVPGTLDRATINEQLAALKGRFSDCATSCAPRSSAQGCSDRTGRAVKVIPSPARCPCTLPDDFPDGRGSHSRTH